jgi:iron complex outermembrane recepter protein
MTSRVRKPRLTVSPWGRCAVRAMPIASAVFAAIHPALAQEQAESGALQEVVVTAEKRTENLQNVPLSIVALSSQQLEQLNIQKADDYIKFLPSVTSQGGGSGGGANGPGFGHIIMRGVSSDASQNHSGPLPTVGTYLDEQPVTTIQGALDVHLYDIARVESLSGPQGTLYGASSEAGTIRIITNKPDPSGFKAGYELEGNYVDHGNPGALAQGFVNLPLGSNAAVRLVGWAEHEGGYIDNINATRTFPQFGITINNSAVAENKFNDVDIYGARAALKIDLNDNWSITPFLMGQQTKANGFNAFAPNVGDLELEHFSPDNVQDHFFDAALTIEGKISDFNLTYAGAYLHRNDITHTDYSDYSLAYDISSPSYTAPIVNNQGQHINPTQMILGEDGYLKNSQEIRLQSPADWRLRFVVGGFYQRQQHDITQDYQIANLANNLWVTGWQDTWWLTKQERVDRDYAAFGEVTFDITSNLSLLAGLRHFKYDNSLAGFRGFGLNNPLGVQSGGLGQVGCAPGSPPFMGAPCTSFNLDTSGTGNTPKVTLTYKFDADKLIYATYSKGFRPGGVNRLGPNLPPYQADFLKNYEIGWKTTWLNNHLRFNGAFFREDWDNFQFAFLGAFGLTQITNAGGARIKGVESELQWAVVGGFSLSAGLTVLEPVLSEELCAHLNPNGTPDTTCTGADVLSPVGTQLPSTSRVKWNTVARYDFPLGEFSAFAQGAFVYQTAQWDDLRLEQRAEIGQNPAYGTLDLAFGLDRNSYALELFLANAFDKRGEVFRFNQCASCSIVNNYVVPTQPRTIAIKFSQKF